MTKKIKFRLIMTTVLETDDLELIREDFAKMNFKNVPPDVLEIINKGTELFEETQTDKRQAKTFVRVDSI